jgi:hypothetical protein
VPFPPLLPDELRGHVETVEIVANGDDPIDAAERAVTVLVGPESVVVGATPAGGGWYRLRARLTPPVIGDVVEILRERRADAAVGLAGGAGMVLLALVHGGIATDVLITSPGLLPVEPEPLDIADPASVLGTWLATVGLPLGRRRVDPERLVEDVRRRGGPDAVHWLFTRLGLTVREPEMWWEALGGATWAHPISDAEPVGLQRVNWHAQRWAVARGADFWGLWDRERPDAPVETWPFESGPRAAEARLHELVVAPILRATMLPGERAWCFSDHPQEDGSVTRMPWLAHRSAAGAGALIEATDPPRTNRLYPAAPTLLLSATSAQRLGVADRGRPAPGAPLHLTFPNRDLNDLLLACTVALGGRQASAWQRVPDGVDRALLATVAYVRAECPAV